MKPIPAEIRGYIEELRTQIRYLSERAASIASELAVARQESELQKGRIQALEQELAASAEE